MEKESKKEAEVKEEFEDVPVSINLGDVYMANRKVREVARKTDLVKSTVYDNVYLKTENLQNTGSFKVRGAYYKISTLTDEEKAKGVVACSAGNHAQGVALSCKKLHIPATIFMPATAPVSKIEATRSYGAEVKLVGLSYDDAYEAALEFNKVEDKTFIHPFNDETLIAGQATVGLEIVEQMEDVDIVVVPIGGGGLISGVSFAVKNLKPDCKIIGVEAQSADSMYQSLEAGQIKDVKKVSTFADGIAVKTPGDITYKYVKKYVDEIVTVNEDEIADAVLQLIEKQKIVAEGSGAVPYAALMNNKFEWTGKKVALVVSGGNIDVQVINRAITRGLIVEGRRASLEVSMYDAPGQLTQVSEIFAKLGANVLEIQPYSSEINMAVNSIITKFGLETRDHQHIDQIKNELRKNGFEVK
ncbi:MAG: threonine ammonia-lyase [Finegoldia sp.]|nr:threonine ammonia-lyase [Finegoldia sp.]